MLQKLSTNYMKLLQQQFQKIGSKEVKIGISRNQKIINDEFNLQPLILQSINLLIIQLKPFNIASKSRFRLVKMIKIDMNEDEDDQSEKIRYPYQEIKIVFFDPKQLTS
ncbi:unnamed protein product [Paramecium primaurelia]|uniref:Uncharacterized protein n=1 Tax=Paramecium primaurelia TaxID=5886 RepID=A0A8S1LDL7_PARPR|nr:unnamed protein product [Paramecium primaurelia]